MQVRPDDATAKDAPWELGKLASFQGLQVARCHLGFSRQGVQRYAAPFPLRF
jgi:hypothetical protein